VGYFTANVCMAYSVSFIHVSFSAIVSVALAYFSMMTTD